MSEDELDYIKEDVSELSETDRQVLRTVSQVGRLPDIHANNIDAIESSVIWLTECGLLMKTKGKYRLTRYGNRVLMASGEVKP